MTSLGNYFYDFGPFRLEVSNQFLLHDGIRVALMPKTFDILFVLIERAGQVVAKEELMQRVWPDVAVEENNLNKHISILRKVLTESGYEACRIETIPRHGYRFVAEVHKIQAGGKADDSIVGPLLFDEASISASQEAVAPPLPASQSQPAVTDRTNCTQLVAESTKIRRGFVIMLLVTLLLIVAQFLFAKRSPSYAPVVTSIAVLPFKSLNAPGVNDDLSLGLADNMIHRLGLLNQLSVRPMRAVGGFESPTQDPLQMGRELNVEAILDGGIQRTEGRVRITTRLLRVSDGQTLWAETFDERWADIFAVQDKIAERVAGALLRRLTRQQQAFLAKRATESPDAYLAYARGRFFWNQRNTDSFLKAIQYFEEAIRHDPQYALAYSGLADSYTLLGVFGAMPPPEASTKAHNAARKALELDEQIAEAHASLAVLKAWYEWDWAGAEQEYRRALELNPNYSTAHQWYSLMLAALGRQQEAIEEMQHAQRLEPLSVMIAADLGLVYAFAQQYDEALHNFRRALELSPDFVYARRELGRVYVQKGMYQEALAEFEKLVTLEGRMPTNLVDIGYTYGVMGQKEDARKILQELLEKSKQEYVAPMILASVYAAIGERDRAFQYIEQEYEQHSDRMINLKTNYLLTPLRDDPRFAQLLRRVGLS
jgi:DNA-binding winged helix-turn-helix (wHTH) protein/TolB-like protein/Tfp pilus assembly protein PilF